MLQRPKVLVHKEIKWNNRVWSLASAEHDGPGVIANSGKPQTDRQTDSCHEFCLLQHPSCFSPRDHLQPAVEIEMFDLRPAYAGSFRSTD